MKTSDYLEKLAEKHKRHGLWPEFGKRFEHHFPRLLDLYTELYEDHVQIDNALEALSELLFEHYTARAPSLHRLDQERERDENWYLSNQMVGAVAYVDLFAGNLAGIRAKLPYLQALGITYLHLMPLFECPDGNSDGGYAISDFRRVSPELGTMDELAQLASEMRERGISLVLDFVFNHTSDQHQWAKAALSGDAEKRDFYYLFPDRKLPDQYEITLREIFPDQAPGNFVWNETMQSWVWATFNTFQWDLNYRNPLVFNAMLGEMLYLANQGVEILRLDAVAFVWKELGTPCENLPQAHTIIQAYNAAVQIAAPAMLFKSEAIVHPDDVDKYISLEESQLSYNPTMMACIWEALATRDVRLLSHSMRKRYAISPHCAWVNYVRVHDDIGWSFADEDAREVGINGYDHRLFLNQFYTGRFAGSFASGEPFNYNPANQDMRICGTAASLAGLQRALEKNDLREEQLALERLQLIHSIILSTGGIPLLYIGDEIATLNDYSYLENPHHADDSRWVHRVAFQEDHAAHRNDTRTTWGYTFNQIRRLITLRKSHPAFGGSHCEFYDSGNTHVLLYWRPAQDGGIAGGILCVANFSEKPQHISAQHLSLKHNKHLWQNLVDGRLHNPHQDLLLLPYQFMWLAA